MKLLWELDSLNQWYLFIFSVAHCHIAISSHQDMEKEAPLVSLQPQHEGRWRWVDTETLLFEPKVRFRMSSEYTVTIPTEMKSINGHALEQPFQFSFSLPTPRISSTLPSNIPAGILDVLTGNTWSNVDTLDPLIVAVFDQKVKVDAIYDSASIVGVLGFTLATLRRATKEEIDANPEATALIKSVSNNSLLNIFRNSMKTVGWHSNWIVHCHKIRHAMSSLRSFLQPKDQCNPPIWASCFKLMDTWKLQMCIPRSFILVPKPFLSRSIIHW